MSWLLGFLGVSSEAGRAYAWWSGSGSVIVPWLMQSLTIALLFWWHHQCHVGGCYRYARRTTAAGDRACRRHHPEPEKSAGELHAAHEAAKATESEA